MPISYASSSDPESSARASRAPRQLIRHAGAEGAGPDDMVESITRELSPLQPEGLDVVQHGLRMQERGGVDLADEAGVVDQEHLEHVRELPARLAVRSVDRPAHVLAKALDQRHQLAR